MTVRIALGGIHIESSTFSRYISGDNDFQMRRGEKLLAKYPWIVPETFGRTATEFPPLSDVEWVPLVHAGALPGGVVSASFYATWESEYFTMLTDATAQGLDGVLLDIHGAMSVEGKTDAEGELAKKIREIVGPRVPIACCMDLHGNVTDDLFFSCDLLTAYRTAPHIDALETRYRAIRQLYDLITTHKNTPFYKAKVDVPILLPGEKTSTVVEPGSSLYALIDPLTTNDSLFLDAVSDIAIWMGFPWADQKRCHGVVVASGTKKQQVEKAAMRVAQHYWANAAHFVFVGPTGTMDQAADRAFAMDAPTPFFVSDTGDNPGAGGYGDSTALLRIMLEKFHRLDSHKHVVFASLFDPDTVDHLFGSDGQETDVCFGAKPHAPYNTPITAHVTVKHSFTDPLGGRTVILADGFFDIIVTEKRIQYATAADFARAGFEDLGALDIVIVKIGYLEPDLAKAAQGWIMALSPGSVDQDLPRLPFHHLSRPLVPFDDPSTFDPMLHVQSGSWPRS